MHQLTIPTKISLLRIPLAIIFFILVWHAHLKLAIAIFLITALSDFIDGYIAKNKAMESVIGKIVDPVADRIFIVSSFFVVFFGPLHETMSHWVFFLVVAQDILLGVFGAIIFFKGKGTVSRSILGKIATLCQEIFIPVILLKNIYDYPIPLLPFEIVVVVTSLISGLHHFYIWINLWKSPKTRDRQKGTSSVREE